MYYISILKICLYCGCLFLLYNLGSHKDVSTARLLLMLLMVLVLMAALKYYASTLPAPTTFTADPPLH